MRLVSNVDRRSSRPVLPTPEPASKERVMPIRRSLSVLLLPLIFLLAAPVDAFVGGIAVSIGRATNSEGAEIPPFSADAQIETEEHQISSHVYYKPGMVRDVDGYGRHGNGDHTTLRRGQGVGADGSGHCTWKRKSVRPNKRRNTNLSSALYEGTEMVDGVQTKKYKTIYEGPGWTL